MLLCVEAKTFHTKYLYTKAISLLTDKTYHHSKLLIYIKVHPVFIKHYFHSQPKVVGTFAICVGLFFATFQEVCSLFSGTFHYTHACSLRVPEPGVGEASHTLRPHQACQPYGLVCPSLVQDLVASSCAH